MHVLQELLDPIPITNFCTAPSPESLLPCLTGPGATRRTSRRPISLLSWNRGTPCSGSCAMAALCTIMRASPGRRRRRTITAAIHCSCGMPNGPLPNSRRSPRPSRSFHAPVDIQVYLTPDQHQAFGWHYDLEEVFIIQVQGCKEYSLRQTRSTLARLGHHAGRLRVRARNVSASV